MSVTPTCPCGWTGKPQDEAWRARANLRQHLRSNACDNWPEETEATCTILTGTCSCDTCRRAAADHSSPLDLGGRWVAVGGVRKWVTT